MDSRSIKIQNLNDVIMLAEQYRHQKKTEKEMEAYQWAISLFSKATNPEPEDKRKMALIYHRLGDYHFNTKRIQDAASYYVAGANLLQSIEFYNDDDRRRLILFYIDLTDACLELSDHNGAYNAFINAKKAFDLIKNKKEEELPLVNSDIEYFYGYYEKKCSTSRYLMSTPFKNNQQFLFQTYRDNTMLSALDARMSGLTTADGMNGKQEESKDELENMFGHLGMKESSPFVAVPVQAPEDEGYRSIVNQLVTIGKGYFSKGMIQETIRTYEQAAQTLMQVQQKTEVDVAYLNTLKEQIDILRNPKRMYEQRQQDNSFASHQSQQTTPRVSEIGFHGSRQHNQPAQPDQVAKEDIFRMEM